MKRKIISIMLLALILCSGFALSVFAEAPEYFLYDEADLLTDAEETALEQKLADISGTYNAQIVVCTIASIDGSDIDQYDDYVYDTMGFGYGENHDGVMLLVCMDPREYRILSNGFAGVCGSEFYIRANSA